MVASGAISAWAAGRSAVNIEAVTSLRNASAIVCNDMGKFQGLPCNRPLLDESGLVPLDILHGTFFITGMNGEHFVSLTEEQTLQPVLHIPHTLFREHLGACLVFLLAGKRIMYFSTTILEIKVQGR